MPTPSFTVATRCVALSCVRPPRAANDNGGARDDPALADALRFFAQKGLAAAEEAGLEARRAFFEGRREDYRRWLTICRTLDRRMAARAASQIEVPPRVFG